MIVTIYGVLSGQILANSAPTQLIIDADTGNEMDDLYAIVDAILEPRLEVIGVTSAHFNNVQLLTDEKWHIYPCEGINTVAISQELNEELLEDLNQQTIPHPLGCDRMVGYAWGYYEGAPIPESPAVDFIIKKAKQASPENKLNIAVLGAVTNVAAAVLKDPTIIPNLRCYILSMRYDGETGAWDKASFNARNDINGLDILLNEKALELVVMPGNIARSLTYLRKTSMPRLDTINHDVIDPLKRRWDEVSEGESWIMWDLALIAAIADPTLADLSEVAAPPENSREQVKAYTAIDAPKMEARFWELLDSLKSQ